MHQLCIVPNGLTILLLTTPMPSLMKVIADHLQSFVMLVDVTSFNNIFHFVFNALAILEALKSFHRISMYNFLGI